MNITQTLIRLVEILLFAGLLGIGYFSMPMIGLSEVTCSEDDCSEPGVCYVNDCPSPPYNWFCGCTNFGPACGCTGAP